MTVEITILGVFMKKRNVFSPMVIPSHRTVVATGGKIQI
jgi:hypothetical protein